MSVICCCTLTFSWTTLWAYCHRTDRCFTNMGQKQVETKVPFYHHQQVSSSLTFVHHFLLFLPLPLLPSSFFFLHSPPLPPLHLLLLLRLQNTSTQRRTMGRYTSTDWYIPVWPGIHIGPVCDTTFLGFDLHYFSFFAITHVVKFGINIIFLLVNLYSSLKKGFERE